MNLRLAIRNLLRNKVYSFLIIGGFAIGFAAFIMIGLFYRSETTVNNGFEEHSRIYRLYDVKMNRCNLNWDLFPVLASDYAAVEYACPLDYQDMQLTIKDEQTGKIVVANYLATSTNDFFSVFSVELEESISGIPFNELESIGISRQLATSLFGDQNPLGARINVGNYFFGTVSCVFKEFPDNSSFRADVILNSENKDFRTNSTTVNEMRYNPTNHFIRLNDGTSPENFISELNKSATLKSLDVDSLALQSLDDIYLSELTIKSRHSKGNPVLLKILMAVAALILFLSSINYLNYSVSMQYAKLREVGIKNSFGADRKNLVAYIIVEVTLGIIISLLFALLLTDQALSYSQFLFGKELNITWLDWLAVLPVFLGVIVFVILLNSLAPIYLLSKFKISEFLSGACEKNKGKQAWKKVLLTFQLTVSTALIAIVLIIFKQMNYVNNSDTGFTREQLVKIDIPYNFPKTSALQQEIQKLSFVENTTVSAGCPGMINHKYGYTEWENSLDINCIYVGDDFLTTMDLDLLKGRDFLPGDINKCCLINEQALKSLGWKDFNGEKLQIVNAEGFEVIGVIRDFKFESFHQAVEPLALLMTGAADGNVLSVRVSPGNTVQQIDLLKQTWKTVSPDEPLSFMFYDDFFQHMYLKEKKLASTITFFSLIAIVLTCMGLLGQIFMISMTRVKEIGVRKINGASVSGILFLLNKDLIKMVAVSFVVSTPVAWFITDKWLENFAYSINLNWWTFLIAGLISLIITLITVSWLSWRAATKNPVEALRYE